MKSIITKMLLPAAFLGLFTMSLAVVPAYSYAKGNDKDPVTMKEESIEVYKGSTWAPKKIRDVVVKEKMTGHQALAPEQKKLLEKNKPLDKSLTKKPVDNKLKSSLPNYAEHGWYIVGDDMILVNENNNEVVEIIYGVFQ